MEPTSFELTPAQRGLLESLSRETGKPVSALIDKALEGLEGQVRPSHANGETDDHHEEETASPPPEHCKPIWELFAEAFNDVPEEELERLPSDLAAQVDHYVYGLPKRPDHPA